MSNNIFNEIKNSFMLKNLKNKSSLSVQLPMLVPVTTPILAQPQQQIKNKLISSYEQDYTRNNIDVIKLLQRN